MRTMITGGAGFIGCNLAARLLQRGADVLLYDNLSRPGSQHNLAWLHEQAQHSAGTLHADVADLRDAERLAALVPGCDAVFHLAGQVAVTRSVHDPRDDFESNALGTFNVLEAARQAATPPLVVYASTNKVYGGMEELAIVEHDGRYAYRDLPHGVGEGQPLDFHSPYGCSKGAGDQYVRDYARIYGLPTVVLRQSCIYGLRQFGIEDQGWVAHFVIAAQFGRPITIYGDGKQVRDVLYIDDLLDAYERVLEQRSAVAGQVYNVGGGPTNTLAIWHDFGPILGELAGQPIMPASFHAWRPGDQRVFVSDIRKLERAVGWQPRVSTRVGIARLWEWVAANRALFGES